MFTNFLASKFPNCNQRHITAIFISTLQQFRINKHSRYISMKVTFFLRHVGCGTWVWVISQWWDPLQPIRGFTEPFLANQRPDPVWLVTVRYSPILRILSECPHSHTKWASHSKLGPIFSLDKWSHTRAGEMEINLPKSDPTLTFLNPRHREHY